MLTSLQTVVLSLPRLDVPKNLNIMEALSTMIFNNLCNVDYFGDEYASPVEIFEYDNQMKFDSTTYFSLFFELDVKSNFLHTQYNEEQILGIVIKQITEKPIHNFVTDGKDVDVYIY